VGNIDSESWSGVGEPRLRAAAGWAPLCAHGQVCRQSPGGGRGGGGGRGREKGSDPGRGLLRIDASKPELVPACISPCFPIRHSSCTWQLRTWKKTGDTAPASCSFSSYFDFQLLCLNISHLPTNAELQVLMGFLVSLANPDQLVIELPLVSGFAGATFLWIYVYIFNFIF